MVINEISLHKFNKSHFSEYLSRFSDSQINRFLGPMKEGDEWLDLVLNQTDGVDYAVFILNEMVGEIGVAFPTYKNQEYGITNIAIKPGMQGQGIGKQVIHKIIDIHDSNRKFSWKTSIDKNNTNAQNFFKKVGRKCVSQKPDENDMLNYMIYNSPSHSL